MHPLEHGSPVVMLGLWAWKDGRSFKVVPSLFWKEQPTCRSATTWTALQTHVWLEEKALHCIWHVRPRCTTHNLFCREASDWLFVYAIPCLVGVTFLSMNVLQVDRQRFTFNTNQTCKLIGPKYSSSLEPVRRYHHPISNIVMHSKPQHLHYSWWLPSDLSQCRRKGECAQKGKTPTTRGQVSSVREKNSWC